MKPIAPVSFTHINLVASNWEALAEFYQQVFSCTPVPPLRDQKGEWLSKATGVPDAALTGVHLRLPGYGEGGPTLEIYQYSRMEAKPFVIANRQGYGHIAFRVPDVEAALAKVVAVGGTAVGETVRRQIDGVGLLTFTYAKDPEGNIIELQHLS